LKYKGAWRHEGFLEEGEEKEDEAQKLKAPHLTFKKAS